MEQGWKELNDRVKLDSSLDHFVAHIKAQNAALRHKIETQEMHNGVLLANLKEYWQHCEDLYSIINEGDL
jgi:hypothetical protein